MKNGMKIIDFRNRPPLEAYNGLFLVKHYGAERWANASHRGKRTITPSMHLVGKDGAMETWWQEINEAGIDVVVSSDHFHSAVQSR